MKNRIIILFICACSATGSLAQSGGMQHYYYTAAEGSRAMITPIAHYRTQNNWYGEARYNYDELNTFSLYAGKTFNGGNDFSWEATPLLGGLVGLMNGASVGMNMDLEYKRLFFSSQAQYSFSMEDRLNKYFFNWSEIGYQPLSWIYGGLAVQQTGVYRAGTVLEPGCMVGFSVGNWTIPLYAFSPSGNNRYFVLGVTYAWTNSKTIPNK